MHKVSVLILAILGLHLLGITLIPDLKYHTALEEKIWLKALKSWKEAKYNLTLILYWSLNILKNVSMIISITIPSKIQYNRSTLIQIHFYFSKLRVIRPKLLHLISNSTVQCCLTLLVKNTIWGLPPTLWVHFLRHT